MVFIQKKYSLEIGGFGHFWVQVLASSKENCCNRRNCFYTFFQSSYLEFRQLALDVTWLWVILMNVFGFILNSFEWTTIICNVFTNLIKQKWSWLLFWFPRRSVEMYFQRRRRRRRRRTSASARKGWEGWEPEKYKIRLESVLNGRKMQKSFELLFLAFADDELSPTTSGTERPDCLRKY